MYCTCTWKPPTRSLEGIGTQIAMSPRIKSTGAKRQGLGKKGGGAASELGVENGFQGCRLDHGLTKRWVTHLWQSCQIHAWRPFLGRKSDWPLLWIWEEKRRRRRWPLVGSVCTAEAERQFSSMAHCSKAMGLSSR